MRIQIGSKSDVAYSKVKSRPRVDSRLYQWGRLDWGSGKISTHERGKIREKNQAAGALVMSPAAFAGISRSKNLFTRRSFWSSFLGFQLLTLIKKALTYSKSRDGRFIQR